MSDSELGKEIRLRKKRKAYIHIIIGVTLIIVSLIGLWLIHT